MANLFWREEKTEREEAVSKMMVFMTDKTESRFKVIQEGDDSGSYLTVYVERDQEGNETCPLLPQKFEGWRVVLVFTPYEYIKYIMETRK
tara:strand:+ start:77 stop:346 length:270 start_codon:yes stop_codon:yes gene_type:complete